MSDRTAERTGPNRGNFVRFEDRTEDRTETNTGVTQVQNDRTGHRTGPNEQTRRTEQPRVENLSPFGGDSPGAGVRARLTGIQGAKAGQMFPYLDKAERAGIDVAEARAAIDRALAGDWVRLDCWDPLMTVVAAMKGEPVLSGAELCMALEGAFQR